MRVFRWLPPIFALSLAVVVDLSPVAALEAPSTVDNGNERGAAACSGCHGKRGEGAAASGFPRLAGLNAEYLARQLAAFASGARTSDVMQPIAQALDKSERKALASYYASLNVEQPSDDGDATVAAAGASLAKFGDWPKGVPACRQCHGPSGEGVGASFPAIAGQSAQYIVSQLLAWRDGKRNNDPMHLMGGVAKKLTDDQIASVASYFSRLAPAKQLEGGQR